MQDGDDVGKYRIALTPAEESLVEAIDLSVSHDDHGQRHAAFVRNQGPILAFMALLSERNGILEHWQNYWTDPTYKPGRIKASRKGLGDSKSCRVDPRDMFHRERWRDCRHSASMLQPVDCRAEQITFIPLAAKHRNQTMHIVIVPSA